MPSFFEICYLLFFFYCIQQSFHKSPNRCTGHIRRPEIFPLPEVPSKRPPDSPLPPVHEQGFPVYLPSPRSTTPSIPPVPHSVSMHPHAPVVRNRAVSHQEDSRSLASLLSFLRYVSQSLQLLFQHHIHNHAFRL